MKFLVIQQKKIGDVLASTVICENLKHLYPDCQVHFVANENTLDVLLNNPFVDQVITFKPAYRKNKMALFAFLRRLNRVHYFAVIDAYGKLESNLISLAVKAQYKIAVQKWYTKWCYSHTIDQNVTKKGNLPSAIKDRLQLLSPLLGYENDFQAYPKIFLTEKEAAEAAKKIKSIKSFPNDKVFMIAPLGSSPFKTYPADYMSAILDLICETVPARLLLNYEPSQEVEVKKIIEKCGAKTKQRIATEFHDLSLRDFISITSQCDALIGNEGGAVNMAKALNVPTFCIFSPLIAKAAWHHELDNTHVAIHLNDYKPVLFEGMSKRDIKKKLHNLYEALEPSLFDQSLIQFIKTHGI